jgi:tetratricopeptide (TPR) repeat protein
MNRKSAYFLSFVVLLSLPSFAQEDTAGYWFNKGIALDRLGDYQEAISAYENATYSNTSAIHAWNNIGLDMIRLHVSSVKPTIPQ